MPSPNTILPAATFFYNTQWPEVRDFFSDAVRTRMAMSSRLRQQVHAWAQESEDQESLARRIYRLLVDQTEGDGQFYQNINLVWESKTGNATLLLAKCYETLGIPCDVIFTRPAQFIDSNFNTPFPEMFSYVLLRLTIDGKTIWVDANRKHMPFGYIPFAYRGSDGIILADNGSSPLVKIPDFTDESEKVESHYVMTFAEDGSVEGEGLEVFHGSFASQMVDGYAAMNQVEIKQGVEAGMNTNYPGASVSKVTITPDLPPGTFELISLFTHPGLAKSGPEGLTVPQLLPENSLQRMYASLPSRQFPVRIREPHINEVSLELRLPEGFAWEKPPESVHLTTDFGQYRLETIVEKPRVLRVTRTYHLPAQKIEPTRYAEFQRFCEDMTAQESMVFSARPDQTQ